MLAVDRSPSRMPSRTARPAVHRDEPGVGAGPYHGILLRLRYKWDAQSRGGGRPVRNLAILLQLAPPSSVEYRVLPPERHPPASIIHARRASTAVSVSRMRGGSVTAGGTCCRLFGLPGNDQKSQVSPPSPVEPKPVCPPLSSVSAIHAASGSGAASQST